VKGTNLEIRAATADEMETLMKVPNYAFANNADTGVAVVAPAVPSCPPVQSRV
jgi:hypothetical protein